MEFGEPKLETKPLSPFRKLVEGLVAESDLFQVTQSKAALSGEHAGEETRATREQRLEIIKAIEDNDLAFYLGEPQSDAQLDAIHYLVAIYDELKKDEPNKAFIEETVGQLKKCL